MKKILKKIANKFGYEIVNQKFFNPSAQILANESKYLWLNDKKFNLLYGEAIKATGNNDFFPHKVRSYMLIQLLNLVINKFSHYLVQNFVECGVAEGTTVHEFCQVLKENKKPNQKITFYAFDSFEGLSARQKEDVFNEFIPEKSLPKEQIGSGKGAIAFDLEHVKKGLKAFDFIEYHKGWIPECFNNLPKRERERESICLFILTWIFTSQRLQHWNIFIRDLRQAVL